jgi:hypothetical protein
VIQKFCLGILPVVGMLLSCTFAHADCGSCGQDACGGCESPVSCNDCGADGSCGTRTVYRREYVTEMREVTCTEYRHEKQEKTYTVMTRVPRVDEVTRMVTVCVPQKRTRVVEYTVMKEIEEPKTVEVTVMAPYTEEVEQTCYVCVPVTEEKTCTYTVMEPYTVEVEKTRLVTKRIPETGVRDVRVCGGHWENEMVEVPCGPCGGCNGCGSCGECPATRTVCKRVWVPTCEVKQVPYTTYRCVTEEVPYTCAVTKYRPVTKTKTCHVTRMVTKPVTRTVTVTKCKPVTETRTITVKRCVPTTVTKECTYTAMVPTQVEKTCKVVTYECVPEEQTSLCTVCVPYQVTREVPVKVCKMVAVEVPVDNCGDCCHRRCRGRRCRRGC